ncbi:MAG: UDP-N-acetylglucosamine 2-epimerase (non-hydrolyzing) [Acidimicrobiia bacterium]|nr:UDP-N-acetylglucosamine 2-epimerase (non-hydrolyzing) [Acidimicrobiia bacterium]
MNVLVPFGTRPEIVKLSPVVDTLRRRAITVRTVATGQHTDPEMTDAFFEGLGLEPDARWTLDSHERGDGDRLAAMTALAHAELATQRPDLVLLLGDTHTVPLFCLAARRHHIPVAHLEAGLRSFNETSMEEVNRKVAAVTASLHLAPTDLAARLLLREGVSPERVRVVGNPIVDVLRRSGMKPRPVNERSGVVVTAHRATNVDNPARLEQLVELIVRTAHEVGPVTFPVHPRTWERLREASAVTRLDVAGVNLLPPQPYARMLDLLDGARVVVTDSGGLQEEASWLGVPVVVLRRSTPRWEGVAAGTSVLVGLDVDLAVESAERLCTDEEQRRIAAVSCPYGDGHTSDAVADLLLDPATAPLLELTEPDFVGKEPPT